MYSDDYRLWKKYAHSRPGMRLVGIVRVALPVTVVNVDVVAQEKKPLDLLEEFVLRMIDAGLETIPQIADLCGLNEELVSNVTLSQVADGTLLYSPHTNSFELTPMGDKLVQDLVELKPVLWEFPVTFDRLSWVVVDYPRASLMSRSDAVSDSRTVLPYSRKGVLGRDEITPAALNNVLKFKGRKELTVLEVRSTRFSSYKCLPADLLVFRGDTNEDTSLALVIEGELSQRQDLALAKWNAQDVVDICLETRAVPHIDGSPREPLDEEHPIFTGQETEERSAREVRDFQHHELLQRALSTSKAFVKIASVRLSKAVVDEHFCRLVDNGLKRRVKIDIVYSADPDVAHDQEAVRRLQQLQESHRNLHVQQIAGQYEERLAFDGWRVTGDFPWLSHRTYPQQTLRSYVGALEPMSL
ncbi:hypothetical protein PV768_18650 [Pseudarthrobacter sp. CC4]|uniref:hypothetical protein n=1 Tax=Pseudarthrobacter sp. CC4 TaxID=3029190 RepID=UPI003B8D397B